MVKVFEKGASALSTGMLLKIGNGWVLLRHLQKYWVVGIGYGKDFGRPILNLKVTNLGQN